MGQRFDQFGKKTSFLQLNGIKNKVLNYDVIRGFAPISLLEEISNSEEYQRNIIPHHVEEIKEYLEKGHARFFPEIILGLNVSKIPQEYRSKIKIILSDKGLVNSGFHFDTETKLAKIFLPIKNGKVPIVVKRGITRIDGNHRLNGAISFKDKPIDEFFVSYCFIVLNADQGLGNEELIFHTINNKAIRLIDEENLKVIIEHEETFSNSELKNEDPILYLTRLIAKEDHSSLYPIFDNFGDLKLTNISTISDIILNSNPPILDLSKTDSEIKSSFLRLLGKINTIYDSLEPKEKITALRYIIPLIANLHVNIFNQNEKQSIWWTKKFIDWINLNDLFELENVNYLNIWNIFYKIFQSKSNKIFISMQLDEDEQDLYPTILRAIKEVGIEQNRQLEAIKIDEYRKGVTYGIDEEILKKIREGGLLIGDISTNNANVFHEIGYMMGLCHQKGVEGQVILLCNEKKITQHGENVKFNLQHQKQIRYASYDQLEHELKAELKTFYEQYKIENYLK